MSKKKVLLMGGLQCGGAEHQMVVLATLLKKDGYDVTYLTDDKANFYGPMLDGGHIPLIRIKERVIVSKLKLNIPYDAYCVYRILKRGNYDTIISFLGLWNFFNCLFAKCKTTRHRAITGLRNSRDEVLLKGREKFYTKFEKHCDVKVSNSDNAKRIFANYFPEHKNKLVVIYNAVSLPIVNSLYRVRNAGKIHIVIPASYRDVKNPFGLLDALTLLDEEAKNRLHLTWYGNINGDRECYKKMIELIKSNNLEKVIELKDATKDIANRINEADVVGLFSKSEGLPNAICEGMLLGKPIIMSRVSDFDVFVDASNGILCDWDNPESIADALRNAAKLSDEELVEMGNNSKRKAEKLFAEECIIKQWEEII